MSDRWSGAVIETYSGRAFDVLDPDPVDVRLEDVVAGLAHPCRFGGHCRQFYSVAHHSLHVSRELPGDDSRSRLVGLLHDAAEASVGDLPRPIEANVEGFRRAEARIQDAVCEAFGLAPPTDTSWADDPPDLDYDLGSGAVDAVREAYRTRAERLLEAVD